MKDWIKSYKILSIEAKDLYAAEVSLSANHTGYSIRDKEGNVSVRKFENTLDRSLDADMLREVYEKETRRKNFYFVRNGKAYTQSVINVKFSYSYKEFNRAGKNTYIRAGYSFRDCEFKDGVYIKDDILIAIQTNIEVRNPVAQEILAPYFSYTDGHYAQVNPIRVLKNKAELRSYLYERGFTCDGIRYVRYKRSSGSSRVGKCLFVNEILAERMHKWDKCGLDIKDGDPVDLAALEAYISLPMSSIIGKITIRPENILVVDDYESVFEDDVIAVEAKDGRLVSSAKRMEIRNSIWDGESMMDSSMFAGYEDKGMLLLRNRFFKTCAFNTNLQQWFRDNDITSVSQLNGFTLAKDVSDIKIVTTPSSIKYLKFGTIRQWLSNITPDFGIVKYEKETHFFDGRMVQSHYQLLNTLRLPYEAMVALLQPSLEYVSGIRKDPAVLRYHIGYPLREAADDPTNEPNPIRSKNEIVFKLLGLNNKFARTKLYRDFRNDVVRGYLRNLKQGHILLRGNYSTLLGNGVEMLQHSIGQFRGDSVIGAGNIHSTKFKYGKTILGSRSPHITMGNILLVRNVANDLIDKYFNLSKEIVYINAIGENILQRLNGADYDSDTVLLTDNDILIAAAERYYNKFKVPTCFVHSQKTKRRYTSSDKADLDVKTSVNKIGEIVNLSQQLNSILWDRVNNGCTLESCDELYMDICKLSVLSGIEIDKAKREYIVNSSNEIAWLKTKYKITDESDGHQIKPMFFKMITMENGYELSEKIHYRYFKTSMDFLQKIVTSMNFRQARRYKIEVIPFMDIVRRPDASLRSGYYSEQRDKIITIIRDAREDVKRLYVDYDRKSREEKDVVWGSAAERKQECVDTIDKMSENEYVMYLTLKELDKKENRDVSRFIFEVLFGKPNLSFFKMIEASREPIYEMVEDPNGDMEYFGFRFRKALAV